MESPVVDELVNNVWINWGKPNSLLFFLLTSVLYDKVLSFGNFVEYYNTEKLRGQGGRFFLKYSV